AAKRILAKRAKTPPRHALLVAVSGIDGSGKGYVTEQITSQLAPKNSGVVTIRVDDWLHLPGRRFSKEQPGEHFYEEGVRFAEMFAQLVLPLKQQRSHRTEAALADATNTDQYRRHLYEFEDVEIVMLEGIFLLRRAYRDFYDLALWVDCTFETA